MKRLLLAVAALVTCGLLSTNADASPVFVYAFHTESVNGIPCKDEFNLACIYGGANIVLEQSAVRRGHATLLIAYGGPEEPPPDIFYNDGFVSTDYCTDYASTYCRLAIVLDGISAFLSGSFDLEDLETTIHLSGGGRDWSGSMGSDHGPMPGGYVTGYYKLARVIPEPGSLALLGLGLVGFAFKRRMRLKTRMGAHPSS